jgi:hypothetical protein
VLENLQTEKDQFEIKRKQGHFPLSSSSRVIESFIVYRFLFMSLLRSRRMCKLTQHHFRHSMLTIPSRVVVDPTTAASFICPKGVLRPASFDHRLGIIQNVNRDTITDITSLFQTKTAPGALIARGPGRPCIFQRRTIMISSGQLTHVCEFVCQLELVSAYLSRPATLFCVGLPEKLFNLGGLSSSGLLHQSYDWIPELVEYWFENGRPLIFGVDRWRRGSLIDFSAQILVFIVVVC